jgi:hypothetical protein
MATLEPISRVPSWRPSRALPALLIVFLLGLPGTAAAQGPPPRTTPSREGNVDQFYRAAGAAIAAMVGGVTRFTKDVFTPDGKGSPELDGLREGTIVIVDYAAGAAAPVADQGPVIVDGDVTSVEGTVVRIDRGKNEIRVRFDSKNTETFQLIERTPAAPTQTAQAGNPAQTTQANSTPVSDRSQVVINYTDSMGQRVSQRFRRKA